MPSAALPVIQGSADLRRIEIGRVRVTELVFPPRLALGSHFHERPCFAVVLRGSVEKGFAGTAMTVAASEVVTMPAREPHRDRFERAGAHILVVEPETDLERSVGACAPVFQRVRRLDDPSFAALAWRIRRELIEPDAMTPLAVHGLVLEMLAAAGRQDPASTRGSRAPRWLAEVDELLRGHYTERLRLEDVATAVGVPPERLARAFRRYRGTSLGEHARKLRLEWAASQLSSGARPLAEIAIEAGFADQSHFTRAFRRFSGRTPGRYRRETASR